MLLRNVHACTPFDQVLALQVVVYITLSPFSLTLCIGSSDHHQEQRKGSDVAGKMQERGLLTVEQCQNVRAKARNPKNAKSIASDLAQVIQSWGSTGFTENAAELSSILAEMECSIYQK